MVTLAYSPFQQTAFINILNDNVSNLDTFEKNVYHNIALYDNNTISEIIENPLPPPQPPDNTSQTSNAWTNHVLSALVLQLLASYDTTLKPTARLQIQHLRVLCDGGANRSVTNDKNVLHTSWDIKPYPMGGIGGTNALMCTKKGIYHMLCEENSTLPVEMYFSLSASETFISPTDIVFNNQKKYDSWWQLANCKSGTGQLRFYTTTGFDSWQVDLFLKNKLWYLEHDSANPIYKQQICKQNNASVVSLNGSMLRSLWHHRLCHACKFLQEKFTHAVDGVPN